MFYLLELNACCCLLNYLAQTLNREAYLIHIPVVVGVTSLVKFVFSSFLKPLSLINVNRLQGGGGVFRS